MRPASSLAPAILRGASLSGARPRSYVFSASSNGSGRVSNGMRPRRGLATSARFLSSPSAPTPVEKDVATNAGKGRPASRPREPIHYTPSEDDFKIGFQNLGMNRITKFVVYSVVGVLGTMETIFWCKVLWRWWTGRDEDDA
ncbi:hypothetical protein F4802DRAFT_570454 [Xylaria palmicola]|nr:hypothetical protein F4802DRAFT_570454 [Xylaria palmicola]